MEKYDFLIVGAGLFGATCANILTKKGYKVLVVDKRNHVAGNIYTQNISGINVHKYGAHIFHTSNEKVWNYINQFAKFNDYINTPLANYKGEIYNLPFNMNTFVKIFDNVKTPEDAKRIIELEKQEYHVDEPKNLQEQAINLVGKTVYLKLIKDYTEKQWGKSCEDLPSFIIKRLPVRFEFNNNYFNDKYQGIPIGGYTKLIKNMLKDCEVALNYDYLEHLDEDIANKVIYTGPIDAFFNYNYGPLQYRSVRFEDETLNQEQYQPVAVVNYTSHNEPYTRIIEHKHFENTKSDITIISKEYSSNWELGMEPYYPMNDEPNLKLYQKYLRKASKLKNIYFGGRLGLYQYLDMDDTIEKAFELLDKILNE